MPARTVTLPQTQQTPPKSAAGDARGAGGADGGGGALEALAESRWHRFDQHTAAEVVALCAKTFHGARSQDVQAAFATLCVRREAADFRALCKAHAQRVVQAREAMIDHLESFANARRLKPELRIRAATMLLQNTGDIVSATSRAELDE